MQQAFPFVCPCCPGMAASLYKAEAKLRPSDCCEDIYLSDACELVGPRPWPQASTLGLSALLEIGRAFVGVSTAGSTACCISYL